jgi:hypothetical protein
VINRRESPKTLVAAVVAVASGALTSSNEAHPGAATAEIKLPCGKIGDLQVSLMILGGNHLTHFTPSRDLKYFYRLTEKYNTEEKITETLSLAEQHGSYVKDCLVVFLLSRVAGKPLPDVIA